MSAAPLFISLGNMTFSKRAAGQVVLSENRIEKIIMVQSRLGLSYQGMRPTACRACTPNTNSTSE
jgi:hypothetical protein